MVGERDDEGGAFPGLAGHPHPRHGVGDQPDDLRWDVGYVLGDMVGVAAVGGKERADDLRSVHLLSRPGMESKPTSREDDLTPVVYGQNDIVVEHAKDLHDVLFPDSDHCDHPG